MDKLVSRTNHRPFKRSDALFSRLTGKSLAGLVSLAADIALVLDADGVVTDIAYREASLEKYGLDEWVGKAWQDLVTPESLEKVEALFTESARERSTRRRQVNHAQKGMPDLPVDYTLVSLDDGLTKVALGIDLRKLAEVQQQVVKMQLDLESEYRGLREAQSRYRMIFQMADEPMMLVEGTQLAIIDANRAGAHLVGRTQQKLTGAPVTGIAARKQRDHMAESLKQAALGGERVELTIETGDGQHSHCVVDPFRESGRNNLLLRFSPLPEVATIAQEQLRWIDQVPESFVVTDQNGIVIDVNEAFLDSVQLMSRNRVVGRGLQNWLGSSSVDMQVLLSRVREDGNVRRFSSVVRDEFGATVPVNVSAGRQGKNGHNGQIGILISEATRRDNTVFVQPSSQASAELNGHSADFSELVGRVPLKELVRDAVDVIEKMCIEAALEQTGNNRASAADLLGLSRQSLYIKLRRHGLHATEQE